MTRTTAPSEPTPETSKKPAPLSILICTPCLGDPKTGMAWSVARAMAYFMSLPYAGEKSIDWEIVKGSILPEVRTRLVSQAVARGATHILWWDADIKAPKDAVTQLYNHGLPVVGANYPTKEMISRPTAYADNDSYVGPLWTTAKDEGVVEVAHMGMGLMLCDVRVFDMIDLPFFNFEPLAPDFVKHVGEDVYFCRKLREKGMSLFVDHKLSQQVAHIGDFEYTNWFAETAEQTKQKLYRDGDTTEGSAANV